IRDFHVTGVQTCALPISLKKLAVEGSVWEPAALRDAGVLLRSARETRRVVLQQADHFPLLAEIAEPLLKREDLEEAIRSAIDDGGAVRDTASRELARVRGRKSVG